MENEFQSKLNRLLNVDFRDENSPWLTSTKSLRKLIGILGIGLPVLLYIFLYLDSCLGIPLQSISHYYFTRVSGIFIIIVSLLAIFLIVYKGKEPKDFWISFTAGIFALFVLLFPTSNITDLCCDISKPYAVTVLKGSSWRSGFHYLSAAIFLTCLAYMSLFLFTKSDKSPAARGARKRLRNRIYRTCGIIMIVALLIIFAGFLKLIPETFYEENHLTFWMEALAIESFGFAWLIKGETLFKD